MAIGNWWKETCVMDIITNNIEQISLSINEEFPIKLKNKGEYLSDITNNNVDIKFSTYDAFFGMTFIRYAQYQTI
jgi:hypothetical protein